LSLDRLRRRHRPGRRAEDRQHRVARHVDDPPMLRFDLHAEHCASRIQRRHGGLVVDSHQPRIAGRIGSQDRGQTVAECGIAHATSL
jgi:hypothetical protein